MADLEFIPVERDHLQRDRRALLHRELAHLRYKDACSVSSGFRKQEKAAALSVFINSTRPQLPCGANCSLALLRNAFGRTRLPGDVLVAVIPDEHPERVVLRKERRGKGEDPSDWRTHSSTTGESAQNLCNMAL